MTLYGTEDLWPFHLGARHSCATICTGWPLEISPRKKEVEDKKKRQPEI